MKTSSRGGCAIVSRVVCAGAVVVAVLLPVQGAAMFARMSDEELIRRSDLIVIGEWVGQSSVQVADTSAPLELGAVAIAEVLKGAPAQSLVLVATAAADAPRTGDDITYRRGDRGVWLLRLRPGGGKGIYLADHPQRFVPEAGGAARIEGLRRLIARR